MGFKKEFVELAKRFLDKFVREEDILKMSPQEKEAYLKALDIVYGPKEERAKKMGYNLAESFVEASPEKGKINIVKSNGAKDLAKRFGTIKDEIVVEGYTPGSEMVLGDPKELRKIKQDYRVDFDKLQGTIGKDLQKQEAMAQKRVLYDPSTGRYDIPESMNIRSVNANFDPRFASSKNRMLGIAAGGTLAGEEKPDLSPLPLLEKAVKAYDDTKEKLSEYLSKELNLSKDESTREDIKKALEFTLDPLALTPFDIPAELLRSTRRGK